jgi:hypothetical protein
VRITFTKLNNSVNKNQSKEIEFSQIKMATDTETKREVMELPVTPTPTFNQVLQQVTDDS